MYDTKPRSYRGKSAGPKELMPHRFWIRVLGSRSHGAKVTWAKVTFDRAVCTSYGMMFLDTHESCTVIWRQKRRSKVRMACAWHVATSAQGEARNG